MNSAARLDRRKAAKPGTSGHTLDSWLEAEEVSAGAFAQRSGLGLSTVLRIIQNPERRLRPATIDVLARETGIPAVTWEAMNEGRDAVGERTRKAQRQGGLRYDRGRLLFDNGQVKRTLLGNLTYPPEPLSTDVWERLVDEHGDLALAEAGQEKAEAARLALIERLGPEAPACGCGCGERLRWPDKEYLNGHNRRGAENRPEHRARISAAKMDQPLQERTRERLSLVLESAEASPAAKMIAGWVLKNGLNLEASLRKIGMTEQGFSHHCRNQLDDLGEPYIFSQYAALSRRPVEELARVIGRTTEEVDREVNPVESVKIYQRVRLERTALVFGKGGDRRSLTKAKIDALIEELLGRTIEELMQSHEGRIKATGMRAVAQVANPITATRPKGIRGMTVKARERNTRLKSMHDAGLSYAAISTQLVEQGTRLSAKGVQLAVRRYTAWLDGGQLP